MCPLCLLCRQVRGAYSALNSLQSRLLELSAEEEQSALRSVPGLAAIVDLQAGEVGPILVPEEVPIQVCSDSCSVPSRRDFECCLCLFV